jgi:hypothetical protein
MAENSSMPLRLPEILGAAAGAALAYLVTSHMPGVISAFACALAIALLSFASSRLTHPVLWWTSVGAIAGSVLGAGSVLAASLEEASAGGKVLLRYTVIGTLALAGLVGGIFLGKDIEEESIPKPAEFLKRASGLTVALFAIVVTVRFPAEGLDSVRALSSRMSTTLTIVVTSLAVPGWIGFLIGTRVGEWLRARAGQLGLPAPDGSHATDVTTLASGPEGAVRDRSAETT